MTPTGLHCLDSNSVRWKFGEWARAISSSVLAVGATAAGVRFRNASGWPYILFSAGATGLFLTGYFVRRLCCPEDPPENVIPEPHDNAHDAEGEDIHDEIRGLSPREQENILPPAADITSPLGDLLSELSMSPHNFFIPSVEVELQARVSAESELESPSGQSVQLVFDRLCTPGQRMRSTSWTLQNPKKLYTDGGKSICRRHSAPPFTDEFLPTEESDLEVNELLLPSRSLQTESAPELSAERPQAETFVPTAV